MVNIAMRGVREIVCTRYNLASHTTVQTRSGSMENIEPVELNDAELAAVAGGFSVSIGANSTLANAFNNSGNITLTNATVSNSAIGVA